MNSQDFKVKNPEFKHRLVVKKIYNKQVPIAVEISKWLFETFGIRGDRWLYQSMAHPDYLVYWFKNEADLMWAQLMWK